MRAIKRLWEESRRRGVSAERDSHLLCDDAGPSYLVPIFLLHTSSTSFAPSSPHSSSLSLALVVCQPLIFGSAPSSFAFSLMTPSRCSLVFSAPCIRSLFLLVSPPLLSWKLLDSPSCVSVRGPNKPGDCFRPLKTAHFSSEAGLQINKHVYFSRSSVLHHKSLHFFPCILKLFFLFSTVFSTSHMNGCLG